MYKSAWAFIILMPRLYADFCVFMTYIVLRKGAQIWFNIFHRGFTLLFWIFSVQYCINYLFKKCLFVAETPISYIIDNFLFMFSFSDAKTQNAELRVESWPASTSLQPLSSSFPRPRFPAFFWHPFVNAFTPFY